MCNHYRLRAGPEELRGTFAVDRDFDLTGNLGDEDRYPRRPAPVVRSRSDGTRELVQLGWGHPYYRREKGTGKLALKKNGEPYAATPTTNIRHPHYPMFRDWLAPQYRCLVPANAFAEPNPNKREGQDREVWFEVDGGAPFAFAGIWRSWEGDWDKDREAEESDVFAFLTTEPNEVVAPIHPKAMPVILAQEDYEAWLTADWSEAKALQRPLVGGRMKVAA